MGPRHMLQFTIILPFYQDFAPFEEQKSIAMHVMKIEKKHETSISSLMNQIETLKEYKTTLINSAVTGKIKVV